MSFLTIVTDLLAGLSGQHATFDQGQLDRRLDPAHRSHHPLGRFATRLSR